MYHSRHIKVKRPINVSESLKLFLLLGGFLLDTGRGSQANGTEALHCTSQFFRNFFLIFATRFWTINEQKTP